jgi:hypothetical protein
VIIITILSGAHPFQDPNVAVKFEKVDKAEVDIPDFVSPEATDLVKAILRRRPSERPTIPEIWAHPWVSADGEGPLVAEVNPTDPVLHAAVCTQLSTFGVPVAALEEQLAAGEVGGATVDYHLLMEKQINDKEEAQRNAEIAAHASRLVGLVGPDSPFRQKKKDKMGNPKRRGFGRPPPPAFSPPRASFGKLGMLRSPPQPFNAPSTDPAPPPPVVEVSTVVLKNDDGDGADEAGAAVPADEPQSPATPVQMRPRRGDDDVEVPEGHRLSTDIDTGMQFLTPIRPTSRQIPATSATCHMQRRRSVSGAAGDGFTTPVRRRNSRAGLVSMTQFGNRRRPVAARINSRGALLAMLRDTPLKETPIGISPASPKQDGPRSPPTGEDSGRRRAASLNITTKRQSEIAIELAELSNSLDARPGRTPSDPEMHRRFSHTDVFQKESSRVGSSDMLDVVAEEPVPQAPPPQMGGLALPFSNVDGRSLSHGAHDPTDSLLKPEPVFRKLRSDGGNRLKRLSAAPQEAPVATTHATEDDIRPMRDLPQSLDLAVSLPTVPFNAATTSSLPPHRIMTEAMRVLTERGIDFTVIGQYKIACQCRSVRSRDKSGGKGMSKIRARSLSMKEGPETVGWEMEICMLPKLDMHGIRLHRVCGNIWTYKEKVQEVTSAMKL